MDKEDDFEAFSASLDQDDPPPAPAPEEKPAEEKPAEEKPGEAVAQDKPAGVDSKASTESTPSQPAIPEADRIKQLQDELRRVQEQERRWAGMVPGLQRKASAAEAEAAALKAKLQEEAKRRQPPPPSDDPAFDENFPDIAAKINAERAERLRLQSEIEALKADVKPTKEELAKQAALRDVEDMNGEFPGWIEEAKSPRFQAMLDGFPSLRKQFWHGSGRPDAEEVLRVYGKMYPDAFKKQGVQPPPAAKDDKQSALDDAVGVSSGRRGSPSTSTAGDFDYWARKLDEEEGRRRMR